MIMMTMMKMTVMMVAAGAWSRGGEGWGRWAGEEVEIL